MKLYSIWGIYEGETDPELLDCWDESSVDENLEGYREKLKGFKESSSVDCVTEIVLVVDYSEIQKAVVPPETMISAKVEVPRNER